MSATKKSRYRDPALLPETMGELLSYLAGITAISAGFFFSLITLALVEDVLIEPPYLFQTHPVLWFIIGFSLLAFGATSVLWSNAHRERRTKATLIAKSSSPSSQKAT